MLVLTRKLSEKIRIGHNVTIEILELKEGRVKMGVTAPSETPIHRQEVYDRIQAEKRKEGEEIN